MEENLSYPYRRFSNDIYAEGLLVLLEENNIPYEIVSEPEGVSSVFLGTSVMPGMIVMVNETDAMKIRALENKNIPEKIQPITFEENEEFDALAPWWIVCAYVMVLLFSPVALILGLHFMTAKRRQTDMTYRYAYNETIRRHGKIIFWSGIFSLAFAIYFGISIGYHLWNH